MLGVVTNGNMFFLRTSGDQGNLDTAEGLRKAVGSTIGVVQLGNVPGLTFRAVLEREGIPYQILDGDTAPAQDKLNLKAFEDASDVGPGAGCDFYLCPEPLASAKVAAFKAQNS